ncbi:hypothetical protein ABRY23_09315 [Melioribacteraceae bacterium 4301-Me]|uniref:DHH family phosphoesterase n=1 Tax=Pyranulibacter aquaticus TaxID=3163344 RepID=UPI003599C535
MSRYIHQTIVLLTLVLFLSSITYSQSDYEKVRNFKTKYKEIEDSLKNAKSFDDVLRAQDNLEKLKIEFSSSRDLLDKSLYPESYNSAIEKLENAILLRKSDFSQIVELKTQVDTLKSRITILNEKNASLLLQIKELQLSQKKDKQTIASLQKLVATLRANLLQRDELVRNIVDSLLVSFVKAPSSMSDAEKQNIFNKIDSGNLFYNIERAISDNIQFLSVTSLTPDDLNEIKKQHKEFSGLWKKIGSKLSEVYLNKSEKIREISLIDNMFEQWNQKINEEIWSSINKEFRSKDIPLLAFNNGDEFTVSISNYIDDEIKNLSVRRKSEALKTFDTFTDSVWFGKIKPIWVPLLINNNLLTEAQKDTIENRIAQWKEKVEPSGIPIWIYIIAALLILSFFIALFRRNKNQKVIQKTTEQ